MNALNGLLSAFGRDDLERLHRLRQRRRAARAAAAGHRSAGQVVADGVAALVGSWHFIIGQSVLLGLWISANVLGWMGAWDPYPFILLNLVLSFQAAYTAPIIMMSQNRQADIDRERAKQDYDVNLKAELEIELLHQKIDLLREQEIARLTRMVEDLTNALAAVKNAPPPLPTLPPTDPA
ncbi:DUF1003 domain-containing protein [Azospirillum rugosum]|uniref:Membrane protein n=1 Tax=Azospirillum rugosum TaxID=416170 RepID=A0ABS4SS51_9PROT|nr:DUF1003 domain-containing protein [Azospirillum rugosum]MBP2295395.1 putative membrane protein [Azospirillum rugosum]MDQ0528770.1 putative membrane protein [Azospirillum rugosum]